MDTEIEKRETIHTLKVYDSEKEDFVDISPEIQRHAAYVHQQIALGTFSIALAIKKMFDEKLYLGLGCSSKVEYCETMLPFGRQQAYKYYAIGRKFQNFLPANGENVAPVRQIEDIPMKKLYELTKIDEADFEELMTKGEVEGVSLDEIRKQTYNDAITELAKIKNKSSRRISTLEAENEQLKAEQKALDQKIDEANEKLQLAQEIQERFGEMATSIDDKHRMIKKAAELLTTASELMLNCMVTVDDPVTLKADTVALFRKLEVTIEYWKINYGPLLLDMEDLVH